ncbi:Dot/Icm secretion system substrate [Legionella lansingensis]|uniref:Substrate of the Dot/Icm secretion system n=1 Tax=Legionella lansingensis TaxID=45067 RepID=A0A0W0W0M2_9GAMM|nr:hypothetical protein [Legionella lansingensis]KTD25710.1 substrate of the Dot/Icm secretion system [Legionella lansingensis]SNV49219.1 Dot/Icm secretion system substrate [Legionella lansingensis]
MGFVLSDKFLPRMASLRSDYQNEAKVILEGTQGPNRLSLFLGAKDTKTRDKQIAFIEKWLAALDNDLHPERLFLQEALPGSEKDTLVTSNPEDTQAPSSSIPKEPFLLHIPAEAMENQITALRVLVTASLYLKSQIDSTYSNYSVRSGEYSILEQLLNKAMGLSSTNPMDEETRACCLLAAKRYLTEKGRFETINAVLRPRFTESQWNDFLVWVINQCDGLHPKYKTNYPVTRVMMPLFGKPLELAGYTTGFLLGEMVGKSTKLLKGRIALTGVISSGLMFFMGPTASVGVMLLAPTYAGKILDAYCGVTLAWVLGTVGNMAGQGIGLGVGLSLDLSWKLIYKTCKVIGRLYSSHESMEKLTGICLTDGARMLNGHKLEIVEVDSSAFAKENCIVKVEADDSALKITLNDEQAIIPWQDGQPAYLEALKKLLLAKANEGKIQLLPDDDSVQKNQENPTTVITEELQGDSLEESKRQIQLTV